MRRRTFRYVSAAGILAPEPYWPRNWMRPEREADPFGFCLEPPTFPRRATDGGREVSRRLASDIGRLRRTSVRFSFPPTHPSSRDSPPGGVPWEHPVERMELVGLGSPGALLRAGSEIRLEGLESRVLGGFPEGLGLPAGQPAVDVSLWRTTGTKSFGVRAPCARNLNARDGLRFSTQGGRHSTNQL